MRVANITLFDTSKFRLGRNTEDLRDANEVMSTQKRINELSDDPVGMAQVLDLKASQNTLVQMEENTELGKSWLSAQEAALDSIDDLILEAKTLSNNMINASMNADQREEAVEKVSGILDQIIALGNTQVAGRYIFAGTESDVKPFTLEESPKRVVYSGNDEAFTIQFDATQTVAIGRDGEKTFWEEEIDVGPTNNMIHFTEDIGRGPNYERFLTAEIPEGHYSKEELAKAVKAVMNEVSAEEGYGAVYEVTFDQDTGKYAIREDGTFTGFLRTEFLWESGGGARVEKIEAGGNIRLDDVQVLPNPATMETVFTVATEPSEPLTLVWDGTSRWQVENNPGYVELPGVIEGTADKIEVDLTGNGIVDITVNLANPAVAPGDSVSFGIVPLDETNSVGPDIGFPSSDIFLDPLRSDNEVLAFSDVSIDFTNNKMDFMEIDRAGNATPLTATLLGPAGETAYLFTDPDILAASMETAMETASAAAPNPPVPPIDYAVSYDPATSRFSVKEASAELAEVRMLWNTGPNALLGTSAGKTLGFVNTDNVRGSFGGDLVGANNWDAGDTITVRFSDGETTFDYSRTVAAGDTNADIFADMQGQLAAAFGSDAVFTLNGDNIDFQLTEDRPFTLSVVTDDNGSGSGNDAFLDLAVANATGAIGGDLMGAQNWDLGDDIAITFSDGISPNFNYAHTVANAGGSLGGNLTGSGWDVGDTVSLTFSDGITSFTYNRTIAGGDTNSIILNDMATQLDAAFGPLGADAAFTPDAPGPGTTAVDFSLAHNRDLTLTNFTDDDGSGSGNTAALPALTSGNLPTSVAASMTANTNATVRFASDNNENILADLAAQLTNAFGPVSSFAAAGDTIDYTMGGNRILSFSAVGDTVSGNAQLLRLDNQETTITTPTGTPVHTIGPGGQIANFYAIAADDQLVFPASDNPVDLITITGANNRIDFEEVDNPALPPFTTRGGLTAVIPAGNYGASDMSDLTDAIKGAMEFASANSPGAPAIPILYDVSYDKTTGQFTINEDTAAAGTFGGNYTAGLNWAAGDTVSFDLQFGATSLPVSVTVAAGDTNTQIADKIAADLGIGGTAGSNTFEDPAGTLTITRNGNDFDFVTTEGMSLDFANLLDAGTADAGLDLTAAAGSTLASTGFPGGTTLLSGAAGDSLNADPPTLSEVHILWNTGANAAASAAETLGYNEVAKSAGSFGGDLTGALNWDLGDTIDMVVSDGVNTLNYNHTVSAASGTFGGNLVASGWDAGDTVDLTFSDGVNTLNYIRTVGAADTNAAIYTDLQAQLAGAFGADAAFAVNGSNTGIDFTLNTGRTLTVSALSDDVAGDASFTLASGNIPGSVPATLTAGDGASGNFDPDNTDSLLADLQTQLAATFGADATFTVNGNLIDFQLNEARVLSVTGFTDTGADARLAVAGNLGRPASGTVTPNITAGGDDASFYGVDDDIGLSGVSDSGITLLTIDATNSRIDFRETDNEGIAGTELSITIPNGDYSDMDALAQAIETEMNTLSADLGEGITYSVGYDSDSRRFSFSEEGTGLGTLELLWASGANKNSNASGILGFDKIDTVREFSETSDTGLTQITFDAANNKIDFVEIPNGTAGDPVDQLTATIPPGVYHSFDDVSAAIEEAMAAESLANGSGAQFVVSYDTDTRKFTIKEDGTTLEGLNFLWGNGTNAASSAADTLGFDAEDDISSVLQSSKEVRWGIFDTLIDMEGFLADNDVEGLERSLGRLDTHFTHMVATHSDTGFKVNRLDIQAQVSAEVKLNLSDRRSEIEDADFIAATMDLKAIELAYEAALNSTSKVLSLSLVDFL